MRDQDSEWLIEFSQEYDDGFKVTKRGLDASPMVIKKFEIGRNEVMAFSNHQRANKALTAFHFHPDFPVEDRPAYMRRHEEGHQIAISTGILQAAQRAQMLRIIEERVSGWGRGVAVGLQSVALYLSAGGPLTR